MSCMLLVSITIALSWTGCRKLRAENASVEIITISDWGFGRRSNFDVLDGVNMQGTKECREVEVSYTQKYGIVGIRHEELHH